ncbi:hypothetical protein M6D81_11285 [Paenibacillus sp. J5C_2022]|uniref:hypothetical protein n=1 Tax=Paenibacillus sp. J5C2022 TaxID=2977129 RepID=UPI0021D154DC|nr:hypothetical protein [Paenibacillus sp. J5C2022]MCU6709289.1 hypothetical protein [Paenibacillus sp. J5C2022]
MTKKNPEIPVIPRDVAKAFGYLRSQGYTSYGITDHAATGSGEMAVLLRSIPLDTLMAALVNGYEIELTAEEEHQKALEKVRDKYMSKRSDARRYEWMSERLASKQTGFADGIQYTLRTLNIDIPEVTD